ncbi:hypothetical protein CYMTET_7484 [Cymbomonas tetramitiformis]|uniref:Uncharacterized protein n=1 Tax=Cymbomonas tetramitiformis TaxID=36881 RepID=A0AAE0GVK7_9CHLO|nr:hypothetical protein CYMTET_7484 [Cymbomonas tetramitiformis]
MVHTYLSKAPGVNLEVLTFGFKGKEARRKDTEDGEAEVEEERAGGRVSSAQFWDRGPMTSDASFKAIAEVAEQKKQAAADTQVRKRQAAVKEMERSAKYAKLAEGARKKVEHQARNHVKLAKLVKEELVGMLKAMGETPATSAKKADMEALVQQLFVDAGTVTFTVYTDDQCTELPPRNSVVTLDDTVSCNETPDSSISDLVCSADKITYTNHPNTADCSASPIANELPVGVCTYFPGPVSTWKLIDASTYTCYSGEGDSEATPSPTADSEATPSSSAGGSFEYAIYLDSECTQLGGIGSDMPPWTFDTEVCNSWAGGVGDNSMKISSCSSTCICFTQTAGNRDCSATPNQNVKEACLDTCVEDAQGTFVSMLSFNGCSEALTVSDAEYSCATTGMASDSPSGQGNVRLHVIFQRMLRGTHRKRCGVLLCDNWHGKRLSKWASTYARVFPFSISTLLNILAPTIPFPAR